MYYRLIYQPIIKKLVEVVEMVIEQIVSFIIGHKIFLDLVSMRLQPKMDLQNVSIY